MEGSMSGTDVGQVGCCHITSLAAQSKAERDARRQGAQRLPAGGVGERWAFSEGTWVV